MRAINGLFCVVLLSFAAVQYNDPDILFWLAIYGLAGLFCGLGAVMPDVFASHGTLRAALLLGLIGGVAGTVYYWPAGTAWWTKEVIWDDEAVREGLGMAIVTAGLMSVSVTWWLYAEADT